MRAEPEPTPLSARTGHAEVCCRPRVVLLRDVLDRAGARPVELDEDEREREGRDCCAMVRPGYVCVRLSTWSHDGGPRDG